LILLVARIVVGCVFAVAGVAKLADLDGARSGLIEFGVRRRLAGPASIALPIVELAVAGLLVPALTARAAAVAATVLLLVFAAAIGTQVARGRRPDCNCFGRVGSTRAGWPALLRNLALGAVAATIAVAGPGESIGRALAGVAPAVIVVVAVLVVVIVALGWFNVQLFAQNARLLERITRVEQDQPAGRATPPVALPAGTPAPDFALPDLVGRRWSLADLLTPGRALALVFLDPGCPVCWQIVPGLERIAGARAGEMELAIITRGAAADVVARLDPAYAGPVLLQEAREVAERFGAVGVPSAVIVDHQGRISAPAVFGAGEIERLLSGQATDAGASMTVALG
jgi:uncharacterized membrane protein YphA (DoxX/SURF4 family)